MTMAAAAASAKENFMITKSRYCLVEFFVNATMGSVSRKVY